MVMLNKDRRGAMQGEGVTTTQGVDRLPRPGLFAPSPHSCESIDRVVIEELFSYSHVGVTADVYAHVRLSLQIDLVVRKLV